MTRRCRGERPTIPFDDVHDYIVQKKEFQTPLRSFMDGGKGRHLTSKLTSRLYVVYHYGPHYPMWVYDFETDTWFENHDKFSSTTSRHKHRFSPGHIDRTLSTEDLKLLLACGSYFYMLRERIAAQ